MPNFSPHKSGGKRNLNVNVDWCLFGLCWYSRTDRTNRKTMKQFYFEGFQPTGIYGAIGIRITVAGSVGNYRLIGNLHKPGGQS